MLTAKEKAINWLSDMMPGFDERFNSAEVERLTLLLKEQDRDTRHACAEAVNKIALDHNAISQAHNTVMNTKAV